jgi:hypothetical protein
MVLTNSRKDAYQRRLLNRGFDLGRSQGAIETEQISDEAGNVWGRHRGSGKDLSRSVVESGNYVETRSPDVDTGTKV